MHDCDERSFRSANIDLRHFALSTASNNGSPSAYRMKRSVQLDFLRAVAVLLVIGRHMIPCPSKVSPLANWLTEALERGGWIGVDLFFVLSGFLISSLLFSEYQQHGVISFKRFFIRRGFKIYPPFWVFIGCMVLLDLLRGRIFPLSGLLGELFFIQNYGPHLAAHTWSLAVEEHFYLLLPLLLIFVLKRSVGTQDNPFRNIPWMFAGIAAGCLTLRLGAAYWMEYDTTKHLFPTHLRIDGLFFGVVLSYFYHFFPTEFQRFAKRYSRWLCFGGGLLLLPAFFCRVEQTVYIYTFGLTEFYLAAGMILVGLLGCTLPAGLLTSFAAFLGARSYSVYLWHFYALEKAAQWLLDTQHSWFLYAVVSVIITMTIGVGMSIVVEYPLLYVRDKFFPSRSQPRFAIEGLKPQAATQIDPYPSAGKVSQS